MPPLVAASPQATRVDVSGETFDGARQVSARLTLAPALLLRSPAGGTVTDSRCAVGKAIASGSSPLSVDGRPLLALATSVPLWRDLTANLKGADVSAVQAELTRLGHPVKVTGAFDLATRNAVKALLKTIGVSSRDGVLRLAQVMWLPARQITPATCDLQLGDAVIPGQQFAKATGALKGLTLVNPPGVDGWTATFGSATAPVTAEGATTDAALLAAVEASAEFANATSPGGPGTITLKVALAEPIDVLVVPPSAIITSGSGVGCVVSDGRTIPIRIVTSSLGKTMVAVTNGSPPSHVDVYPDPSVRCL